MDLHDELGIEAVTNGFFVGSDDFAPEPESAFDCAGTGESGVGVVAFPSANFCFSLCFFQASSFSRLILCFSSSETGPVGAVVLDVDGPDLEEAGGREDVGGGGEFGRRLSLS